MSFVSGAIALMKVIGRWVKILQVSLVLLLAMFFLTTDVADARGGCFGEGTRILTTEGYKSIEQLQRGDRILGYNLTTHQQEREEIGEIQVIHAPNYYLINHRIKVTGTHPFYVHDSGHDSEALKLLEVKDLKVNDELQGEQNTPVVISSIEHIETPLTVYNLLSITPDHNFYAEGVLVHNKGGGGHGGSGGHGSWGVRSGKSAFDLNQKTLPGVMLALVINCCVLLPLIFLRELTNFIRFREREFTNDADLIEFTKTINSRFTNSYSISYRKGDEIWTMLPVQSELTEEEYRNVISKNELVEQVRHLFIRYQEDWTRKDFDSMTGYVAQPFYSKQCSIFLDSFGNNFDITYRSELYAIAPLSFQQEEDEYLFRVQINAGMINFELSNQGYVLSGEPYPRSFTEHWHIKVNAVSKKCWLVGIDY